MKHPEAPEHILEKAWELAEGSRKLLREPGIIDRIRQVSHHSGNRAGVRLLLASLLAKCHRPFIDPRKPYTEIGGNDSFSGRTYDERYIGPFITRHRLPCNSTTAFLTPALRNIDHPLTLDREIIGRPRELYIAVLQLLQDASHEEAQPLMLLAETLRQLRLLRDTQIERLEQMLGTLQQERSPLPPSSEAIITLISQHLASRNASRLPVLAVSAAYRVAGTRLGEQVQTLHAHNAADAQTGSMGDIEILLMNDERIATVYEMKSKRVTIADLDLILKKLARTTARIDNYIVITTDPIDAEVHDYARSLYDRTSGVEVVVLDCIGFLRHFLHLFHRLRTHFLETYQELVLNEPESSVTQALKEAFLALRRVAEAE